MTHLTVRNFAHIKNIEINLTDLTILVGAQGTGKSLFLQWLKASYDGRQIVDALRDAGQETDPDLLIDQIFGLGMGNAWNKDTSSVTLDRKSITPRNISRIGNGKENVFFIPAHRSMLISDGWASPFQKLTAETPVVARLFSQNLFDRFSSKQIDKLFPLDKVLKKEYRLLIDDAIYHGGLIGLERDKQHSKRLKLSHGTTHLPFVTWTAGQREFTPLLLGLYHLLPSTKLRKRKEIDWVVIEEPEMGLHPQAISVFMLLVLDLIWRGYKIVISTHSPTILSAVWMVKRLQDYGSSWHKVCEGFQIKKNQSMKNVAETALKAKYGVYLFHFDSDGKIVSKNISSLDPGNDDDDISGWGGLIGFTSQFGKTVRKAANEATE